MRQLISYTHVGDITTRTDKRGDGFYEITVTGPREDLGGKNGIVAVISRQCVGGKWCLYPWGPIGAVEKFKTQQNAMERAYAIAAEKAGALNDAVS